MDPIVWKFAPEILKKLGGKLLEIRESRKDELQRLADDFADPGELVKLYVEPDCQQFPPADENEDESPSSLREPILKTVERYLSGKDEISRRHMFILSDAGMGKTSLLVVLKVMHLQEFWPSPYNCVLLKLGENSLEQIRQVKNKSNTVLLLDALDEDPLAWGKVEARLSSLLRETQNFRRVLITCRTQFFNVGEKPYTSRGQIEVAGFDCPVIYNSLFNDEQCLSYLERRAREFDKSEAWLERARSIAFSMGSLKMRPMLLSHVDEFIDGDAKDWTEYGLYYRLVLSWLKREQRKIQNEVLQYPSIRELLGACRNCAIFLHKNKTRHLSQTELEELILDAPETRNIEFMHIGGRSLLNRDSDGNYRFSHYSIQEFLVVNAVVEGEYVEREEMPATDFMRRLFSVWLHGAQQTDLAKANLHAFSIKNERFAQRALAGAVFARIDLSGCDFSEAKLAGADFSHCRLTGAVFSGADLAGAIFKGADMADARLDHCAAQGAQFQSANLRGATVRDTDFLKSNLNFSILAGARYDHATRWPIGFQPEREGALVCLA